MKSIPLQKLLDERIVRTLLEELASQSLQPVTLAIADADCAWWVVCPATPADRSLIQRARDTRQGTWDDQAIAVPLVVEQTLYGILYADLTAVPLVRVLHLVLRTQIAQALIQKALARETLERYREINLLYRIHETITASVDLDEVIRHVLEESIRIIQADGGSVLLAHDLIHRLTVQGSVGLDIASAEQALLQQAMSAKVFQTGKPRIINDLHHYVRPGQAGGTRLTSLLCSPLKSGDQVLGVIILGRVRTGAMFTAGDEKLLTALASQAGVAIANAQEVQLREQRLRQQIAALRIEINEARKRQEVFAITESQYFHELQQNAQRMRAEFDA